MRRIDPGYEEAAAASGVGPGRRMLDIVVPLGLRGLGAGFVLGFVFSLRELDSIVLVPAGNDAAILQIYRWVHFAHDTNVASLSLVLIALIGLPFLVFSLFAARRVRVL